MLKSTAKLLLFLLISLSVTAQGPGPQTAKAHFEDGQRLLRERSYEAALAAFERSAAIDDKQFATFANIGATSMSLRRFGNAEAAFRTAIRLAPNEGILRAELCRALSLQKKHQAAIESCEEAVRLSPDSDATHAARLTALMYARRPIAEVLRLADSVVGRFRQSELMLSVAADLYLTARNYEFASELVEMLSSMRPGSARYKGMLAEIYLRLGRDADSLASARAALRLEPDNPYANFALGSIFFELGQHEEAIAAFSKVNTDDPRLSDVRYFIAVSEMRRGRNAVAIPVLRQLTSEFPDRIEFFYELGKALTRTENFGEARAAFERANLLRPGTPDVLSNIAMTYMEEGRFETAIPIFEELVSLRPAVEPYRMFLSVAQGRLQLVPLIPEMVAAVEQDPSNVKLRFELASALTYAKRTKEAHAHIDRIFAQNVRDPALLQHIGVVLVEGGDEEKAMQAYRLSLSSKENPAAYLGLAGIYLKKGNFDAAAEAYAKVIVLKPDTPNVMKAYADLLRDNGRRREALEMYKRSLALLPTNGPALLDAGILSLKLGDKEGAAVYHNSLKSVDPDLAQRLARCIALIDLWR